MSGPRDHAALGASNAHRWIVCPGSVQAESGLPDTTSPAAQEGTAAHALAELCLDRHRDAADWIGETIEGVVVDLEMADGVQVYLDVVRGLQATALASGVETRFSLAPLKPPVPMFGTADFWALHALEDGTLKLTVADLKFGQGRKVVAQDNPQARYYLLGAWVQLALEQRARANLVSQVEAVIVQPRLVDETGAPLITRETLPIAALRGWAKELLEAARRTQMPDATRVPGGHCYYCKAKAQCEAFRTQALAVARTSFPAIEAKTVRVPRAGEMTPEQLGAVLEHKALLEEFLSAVEQEVTARLERGQAVPGWALKPKRATRKWANPDLFVAWATKDPKGPKLRGEDLYLEPALRSPAQMEKLVKKGSIPDSLIVAPSSGFTLCRDTNPRAVAPVSSFPALPTTTTLEDQL